MERFRWRTIGKSSLIRQRQVQTKIRGGVDSESADGSSRHIEWNAKEPHEQPQNDSGKKQGERHHHSAPEWNKADPT